MNWLIDSSRPLDMICMGRVAVDFYSEQIGSSIAESKTFCKYLGGCAGNIAVGSARLGLRTSMLSCIGQDELGQFLKNELHRENVDTQLLRETSKHLTGLVVLGVNPPDRFPLIFYRERCADMQIKKRDINKKIFSTAKSLLITGTGLSTKSMRATSHFAVATAQAVNTKIIFDLDYRPVLWGLTAQGDGESRYKVSQRVSEEYQTMLPKCDLIVGTGEEILIAGNANDVELALKNIRTFTAAPIVLKRGEQGCAIYLEDMSQPISAKPFPVKILNVLGAGDAFLSGLMRGLLRGETWQTAATYANACGAIVVTRHGCAPAMPFFKEMQQFIEERACLNF